MSRDEFGAAVLASQERIHASIDAQTLVFQHTMRDFMAALWRASLLNAGIVLVALVLIAALAGVSVFLRATPDGLTLQTPQAVRDVVDPP